jgi:hypothetical protein
MSTSGDEICKLYSDILQEVCSHGHEKTHDIFYVKLLWIIHSLLPFHGFNPNKGLRRLQFSHSPELVTHSKCVELKAGVRHRLQCAKTSRQSPMFNSNAQRASGWCTLLF